MLVGVVGVTCPSSSTNNDRAALTPVCPRPAGCASDADCANKEAIAVRVRDERVEVGHPVGPAGDLGHRSFMRELDETKDEPGF